MWGQCPNERTVGLGSGGCPTSGKSDTLLTEMPPKPSHLRVLAGNGLEEEEGGCGVEEASKGPESTGKTLGAGPEKLNGIAPVPSILKEQRKQEALEDAKLIERAKGGDREAFRVLVEKHQRRAFTIAFSLVRDENDAKEIVQEAFVRVFKGLKSFQGTSSFFTWLYRILHNLSIDHLRKPEVRAMEKRRGQRDEQNPEEMDDDFPTMARFERADPVAFARRKEVAAKLEAALDTLPDYHRSVILMRELEGLSYEEMAQAMNVSKGTIMSRLFHARQKLQKVLVGCYQETFGRPPPVDAEVSMRAGSAVAEKGAK